MSVAPVTSGAAVTGATSTPGTLPSQTVSLTEFMQLLSTEMSNQDPLQPMDPTQTMSQLAQFSSLQQQTQISQTQGLAAANSYLGLNVTVPTGSGANATTVSGVVTGIDSSGVAAGSQPQVILNGTQEFPITSISRAIFPASASSASSTTPSTTGTSSSPTPSTSTPSSGSTGS